MLKSLSIKNFAVIQSLQIDFHGGLNLLTGETGSGKSIIVDALGLLLGGRSSAAQIRTGEDTAIIEGLFELTEQNNRAVQRVLAESRSKDVASNELLIRRELSIRSKNRLFVNGKVVTITTLRALQQFLVEIYGQGEQRALLTTQSHLELLDQFADSLTLRRQVSETYSRWRDAKESLSQLEREATERERAREFLQYQLSEIKALDPKPNEDEELKAERKLLSHAETVAQLAASAYLELYESDASILSRLAAVRKDLEGLCKIDSRFESTIETLAGNVASLTDIAESLRDYGANLEFSAARLAAIESRLAEFERLRHKYNSSLQGLFEILGEISERLSGFDKVAEKESTLRAMLEAAEKDYRKLAGRLSNSRRLAKSKLEQGVTSDLKHVAMENAQFIIAFSTRISPGASDNEGEDCFYQDNEEGRKDNSFSATGMDQVEFLLSANPGESPRPLAFVASGGELSRLMLTLRTVGAGRREHHTGGGTLIFDEVDVGIGGRVAEAVGRRLKALASTKQVLCVTHQPQIARFADHHYLVEKVVKKGRTQAFVRELSLNDRIGELARMIGGDEQAMAARETARWLLDNTDENRGGNTHAKKSSKL